MNRLKKGFYTLLIVFWISCFNNCGLFDIDRNTYHDIGIINRTELPIWVELITANQLLDPNGDDKITVSELIDTLFIIQGWSSGELYKLEFPNVEHEQLVFEEMVDHITHLRIYRVENDDTLEANLDPYDRSIWDIFTSDVPYGYSNKHTYNLYVNKSHFE